MTTICSRFIARTLSLIGVLVLTSFFATAASAQTAAIGKLFSNSGTCSASVISGTNVIVTAGHCCWNRSNSTWIGGWSFAPGYSNGKAPYGTFNWSDARVLNSWINNGDIPSDICLIKLAPDAAGHPVTYYTGWLGRSWNYPASQPMRALGYPGNVNSGNSLASCTAQSSAQASSCGANVLNMACNMTFGSSGGPWIRDYGTGNHVDSTVHGYINQTCTGTFGQIFDGPQFTSNNIVALCNAEGC